ncbi:MAG: hypothetical protein ACQEXJ_14715 [Myxococcota bacterium]
MKRLGIIAVLLLAAVVGMAADDDYVRLALETPAASPYSVVRYEVGRRGRATMAVHRRQLPGHGEPLHGMGLLTRKEAERIWRLVRDTDALSLPDAEEGADDHGPAWRVEVSLDGRTHAFTVRDAVNREDRRYHRLVSGVRRAVHDVAGELPFRNVFFPSDRMGWINIVSIPAARVWVDGFETRQETPLYGYEIESGKHRVRLVGEDGEHERTYEVRVEPSGTTHLHVDLR